MQKYLTDYVLRLYHHDSISKGVTQWSGIDKFLLQCRQVEGNSERNTRTTPTGKSQLSPKDNKMCFTTLEIEDFNNLVQICMLFYPNSYILQIVEFS